MRSTPEFGLTLLLVAGLSSACGTSDSYVEPGATTTTHEREIPGANSPTDLDPLTAQRYIDHVRIGHEVDPEGQVPSGREAGAFRASEPLYVSMEVTDAPAGSKVRLSIRDRETNALVWSNEGTVEAGKSYLTFEVGSGKLAHGDYRADVIIGDETVARREFQVLEHNA